MPIARAFPARRCLATLLAVAGCSPRVEPASSRDGQWIWSRADQQVFFEARRSEPGLVPGLWAGTIGFDQATGRLVEHLALPPVIVSGIPLAVVIRFDPTVHRAWGTLGDQAIQDQLNREVAGILAHLAAAGAAVIEVQLDYDCPTRRLERWAGAVRSLKAGPLKGREVWITSLVEHVRQPAFGRLFRGAVSGHILQVFDTGDDAGPLLVGQLTELLRRQGLPFRMGLGAFERTFRDGRESEHRRWFLALGPFARLPAYRGLWVFPAGRAWTYLAGQLP